MKILTPNAVVINHRSSFICQYLEEKKMEYVINEVPPSYTEVISIYVLCPFSPPRDELVLSIFFDKENTESIFARTALLKGEPGSIVDVLEDLPNVFIYKKFGYQSNIITHHSKSELFAHLDDVLYRFFQ